MLPFLTAYDPVGSSSGSIDPLGAMQTYGALADLLLPGLSTITTRSRYLSMLCWALRNAEEYQAFSSGATGLKERRRAVEPFERIWAVACVAAREKRVKGAADGLRGVTYAEKTYCDCIQRGSNFTPDFWLLKYQGRTGAVGTYWTALVGSDLVDPDSGALMREGVDLAEQFPEPPLARKERSWLADPKQAHRISITQDAFIEWSKRCHLAAAGASERRRLGEALTADDRREEIAQAIAALAAKSELPNEWDVKWLKRLQRQLARSSQAIGLWLPTVLEAIVLTENFHEACLIVFRYLLWWGTEKSQQPVEELIGNVDFCAATDCTRETARLLLEFRASCESLVVKKVIGSFASFADAIDHTHMSRDVLDQTVCRHHYIQAGKLDGGTPKRDWIAYKDRCTFLRPSPRFQRTERPARPTGQRLTHPYRLEQFAEMLRENRIIP